MRVAAGVLAPELGLPSATGEWARGSDSAIERRDQYCDSSLAALVCEGWYLLSRPPRNRGGKGRGGRKDQMDQGRLEGGPAAGKVHRTQPFKDRPGQILHRGRWRKVGGPIRNSAMPMS